MKFSASSLTGFTLIEMLVSIALFMLVMVVAVGSLVALVGADRKAQSIEAVVDNLRFALDDMSRAVRTGLNYNCGGNSFSSGSNDCAGSGSTIIAVTDQNGERVSYQWGANSVQCGSAAYIGGCILRSINDGVNFTGWLPITSPEINITNLKFYVIGSYPKTGSPSDVLQPKTVVVLSAKISEGVSRPTILNLESTMTQRSYDN